MKSILSLILLGSLLLVDCSTEKDYDKYVGVWKPAFSENEIDNKLVLINRIQIERRDKLLVAAVENYLDMPFNSVSFFICEKKGNYLIVKPQPDRRAKEVLSSLILCDPFEIHYDERSHSLFLLNTVFIKTNEGIFIDQAGTIKLINK